MSGVNNKQGINDRKNNEISNFKRPILGTFEKERFSISEKFIIINGVGIKWISH